MTNEESGSIAPYFHYRDGFRTATIVTLSAVIGLLVHADNPWWAAISAFTVANADWRNFFSKAFQRAVGTVVGGISGFVVAYFIRGEPFLQGSVLFVIASYATYKNLTTSYGYAWLLGAATAMIAMYFSLWDIVQLYEKMQDRIIMVCTGVLVAGLVSYLLWHPSKWRASTAMSHKDSEDLPRKWIIRISITAGLVALAGPIVYAGHDLGGMMQIVFTSVVCLAGDISSIRHIAASRFIGCAVGGVMGIALVLLGLQTFILWVLLFFLGMFFIAGWHHNGTHWAYAGTQAGFAFIITAMTSSGPVHSIAPILDRFNGIFIGIFLTLLFLILIGIAQGEKLFWWASNMDPLDEK
ncbi:FUSC family protein [Flexibacterium corallicola]|uniref:FUSC family protein n=1 Tax=Flexibacterium corallicola TaxID=3037259 RepID=UPI00286FA833|nr:FUSC family protein [Pseudovibrio sp. M1P-2-3]